MKNLPLVLLVALTGISHYSLAAALPKAEPLVWQSVVFGQSTDVNFATNVLPDKVGVNQVTTATGLPVLAGPLNFPFQVESRGGKIGNSHDGLTFYYTHIPASANVALEAEITVEQFGPENAALPAGQEGAGLLIRDTLGKPRRETIAPGYEEFPAAANMVMNAIMTQDKQDRHRVKMVMIARNGVVNSWGNAGIEMKREVFQPEIDLRKTPRFRLRLTRTDQGFTASYAAKGSEQWISQTAGDPQRVSQQDPDGYYVGFFAARNARITVHQASLTLSESHLLAAEKFVAKTTATQLELLSATTSATADYIFQIRSSEPGTLTLSKEGQVVASEKVMQAGKVLAFKVPLTQQATRLEYRFTSKDATDLSHSLLVQKTQYADGYNLYVSPSGNAANNGSEQYPLDLASALQALPPGGVLWLAPGDYPLITFPATASGTAAQAKKLRPQGEGVVVKGINLQASYWDIQGIRVTEKSLRISGSHNLIHQVVADHADDTGIIISSSADTARPLWASDNLISHSTSYANKDPGMINADGFAVKMRVGEGNRLVACFAHDNADDGFDLFNKIEDGPNGKIRIENSVALRNVNNGFKLGGEGIPVAHQIVGNIAIENGMDGFSDNFNPGALQLTNNTAIDNQRFNYIFRPGPYTTPEKQGIFIGNMSLRSKLGPYADAVVGQIKQNNAFLGMVVP